MRNNNQLFELIKSLTNHEKRYIKRFSKYFSSSKDDAYIQLFDIINKQDKYDETVILKKIQKNNSHLNINALKVYLYNFILKCLIFYSKNQNTEDRNTLSMIEFLIEKSLFKQAKKILMKTRAKAMRNENLSFLIQLHKLDFVFIIRKEYPAKEVAIKNKEINDIHKQLIIDNTIYYPMYIAGQINSNSRNPEDIDNLNRYKDKILNPTNFKKIKYKYARENYYHNLALYYYENCLWKEYYELEKSHIKLYHTYDNYKNNITYYNTVNNYLESIILSKSSKEEFFTTVKILDEIINNPTRNFTKINLSNYLFFYYQNILKFNNANNKYEKNLIIINKIYKHISKNEITSKYHLKTLNYFIAYTYFLNQQYDNCLDELQYIDHYDKESASSLNSPSRILQCLCNYELNNLLSLEYLIASTIIYLRKNNQLFKTENLLLKFLRKLIVLNPTDNDIKKEFKLFRNDLQQLVKSNPLEEKFLIFLDLNKWVDAKLSSL